VIYKGAVGSKRYYKSNNYWINAVEVKILFIVKLFIEIQSATQIHKRTLAIFFITLQPSKNHGF